MPVVIRTLAARAAAPSRLGSLSLRRSFAAPLLQRSAVIGTQRRLVTGGCPVTSCCCALSCCPLMSNLAAHSTQLAGCASLSGLLYSPLGTAMLILLAYNVVVIALKHFHYSMDLTAKDYVQDQQLYVIMRYGIMCCLLLGAEVLFIEV